MSSSRQIANEWLFIGQGFGGEGYGAHRLEYQLSPDDRLTIDYRLAADERPVVESSVRLSPDAAAQIRQKLVRLRPQALKSDWVGDYGVRPVGCQMQGPHDQGEIVVAFMSIKDGERGASFELPTAGSCQSGAATKARKLLLEVLGSLPASQIVTEFHKAKDSYESAGDWPALEPIQSLQRLSSKSQEP
jgi:hypothetical protein